MAKRTLPVLVLLLFPAALQALPPGDDHRDPPLQDWAAPAFWSPTDAGGTSVPRSNRAFPEGEGADIVTPPSPKPFVPVTPCRIVNTRRVTTGEFDAPALVALTERTFTLPNGPCPGLPSSVGAWSLNITAVPAGIASIGGYVSVYPAGTVKPVVSTLNFQAGASAPPVANAAIVPAAPNGAITVFPSDATHLLIDVNGYYGLSLATSVFAASTSMARCTTSGCNIAPGEYGHLEVWPSSVGAKKLLIPLSLPTHLNGALTRLAEVKICYKSTHATSYIDETTVRAFGTDLVGVNLFTDPTDRTSTAAACYTVSPPTPVPFSGALTLYLSVMFGGNVQFVTIGPVEVTLSLQ